MKVRELIQKLSVFDQNLEVICWTEDEGLVAEDHLFRLFHVNSVELTHGEPTRIDGAPSMKIGKSGSSVAYAVIDITTDFEPVRLSFNFEPQRSSSIEDLRG
jgi:hypothetical protein